MPYLNSSKSSLLLASYLLSRLHSFRIHINFIPILRSFFIKMLGIHIDCSWFFDIYMLPPNAKPHSFLSLLSCILIATFS